MKLLIGGKSVTRLELKTRQEEVTVTETKATTYVTLPDWMLAFKKKEGGFSPLEIDRMKVEEDRDVR